MCVGQPTHRTTKKEHYEQKYNRSIKTRIKALRNIRKGKRAEEVKKAIKDLGGKVETASKKPKTEKKVETKK